MCFRRTLAIGFLMMALTPAAARADGFITPFLGVNFGGDAGQTLSSGSDAERYNWGASFGWMGGGVFGVEGTSDTAPTSTGRPTPAAAACCPSWVTC